MYTEVIYENVFYWINICKWYWSAECWACVLGGRVIVGAWFSRLTSVYWQRRVCFGIGFILYSACVNIFLFLLTALLCGWFFVIPLFNLFIICYSQLSLNFLCNIHSFQKSIWKLNFYFDYKMKSNSSNRKMNYTDYCVTKFDLLLRVYLRCIYENLYMLYRKCLKINTICVIHVMWNAIIENPSQKEHFLLLIKVL